LYQLIDCAGPGIGPIIEYKLKISLWYSTADKFRVAVCKHIASIYFICKFEISFGAKSHPSMFNDPLPYFIKIHIILPYDR